MTFHHVIYIKYAYPTIILQLTNKNKKSFGKNSIEKFFKVHISL